MDRYGSERCLFAIPSTPLVRVLYVRDGVRQEAILANPRSNERLQAVMLARSIGMAQVQSVSAMPERRAAA